MHLLAIASRHPWLRFALLSMGLLLVFAVPPIVTAQEAGSREIKVDLDHAEATLESESKPPGREDELNIAFDNGSHTFEFEYDSQASSNLEVEINVELTDLIEWRDVNGDGLYDPDEDETIQRIGLGDLDPQFIEREDIEENGVQGVRLTGVSTAFDKYPELMLELTLYMFGDFLQTDSISIEPTSMKFDVRIIGFPYQEDDTSLALAAQAEIEVEGETRVEDTANDQSITARVGDYEAFFSWVDHALVDGEEMPVGTSIVKHEHESEQKQDGDRVKWETEIETELYLLYPRGSNIFHDPQIGVRLPQDAARSGVGCSYAS